MSADRRSLSASVGPQLQEPVWLRTSLLAPVSDLRGLLGTSQLAPLEPNANARHPDVLAAQCLEHAFIRSEKGIHWGGRPFAEAADQTVNPAQHIRTAGPAGPR